MKTVKDVESYIKAAPKASQAKLRQLRALARAALPKAEERISYAMPGYKLDGQPVIWFAFFKSHFGIYVPPPVVRQHASALKAFKTTKSGVLFAPDKPLPVALIKKLIRARVRLNTAKTP